MTKKIVHLIFGFFIIALGTFLMKEANLGMNPWGTFHYGISLKTGMPFGTVSQIVGLFLIGLGFFFKNYPGVGTILNMILIGSFVNLLDQIIAIPAIDHLILQLLLCLIGLILFTYGIYLYLICGLGAGPRDGFMLGIMKLTGLKTSYVKMGIESIVFIVGVLLGAPIGIGTVLATFLGGPLLEKIFKFHTYDPNMQTHLSIRQFWKEFRI